MSDPTKAETAPAIPRDTERLEGKNETAFSQEQYELCYPPGIESHWWTLARNQLLTTTLRNNTEAGDVVLEVGCGRGIVVDYLRGKGLDVRGVDLAEVSCAPHLDGVVTTGTDATTLPLEFRQQVKALLLLDVIEHIAEPDKFLADLLVHFPNVSSLVITVPARKEIWSNYDTFYGHFRRYTLASLEDLAATTKWQMAQNGYFFRLPYMAMRLMAALRRDRQTFHRSPGGLTRPLHRLVAAICSLEQRLLPRKIPGASAFAVFRREHASPS